MPNGNGMYNLGGGQITPTSQQGQILPIGEATRQRQMMTGRVLPGEMNWGEKGGRGGEGGGFNILDLLKGLFGGLFGRRGETSQEGRLPGRDPYQGYRQPLPGYGRTPGATAPSRSYSMTGG